MKILNDKPDVREQVLKHGLSYPSDEELVMLILGTGTRNLPVRSLSHEVVRALGKTNTEDTVQILSSVKGMGISRSLAIAAALELGRRRSVHLHSVIRQPRDVVPFVRNYSVLPKEHFICVTLNGGHEVLKIRIASVGTINRTLVHPREIFSEALMENASAMIVCHNHPSGTCTPSEDDIETTQTLIAASQIIGITLLDHIILDRDSYFSFLEHNLLFTETE
ncbi:MAG: DNA repair protein RadC [Treponema sp.]|nr:DNA repair protein RadC [Treponema sp.]